MSRVRSFGGTVSPVKTTLVPLIFSNRKGHKASQTPKRRDIAFLLQCMLNRRKITAMIGAKHTRIMKAVERNTTKHITPLTTLSGVKGLCFSLLSGFKGLQTSISFQEKPPSMQLQYYQNMSLRKGIYFPFPLNKHEKRNTIINMYMNEL